MCRNYLISFILYLLVQVSLQEDIWHSYQFESGHGNRKELFISKVDAVDAFKTQENVLQWRSLSLKNRSIALGLTTNGVTILQVDKIGESYEAHETHTPMNATVFDAAIFKYWNKDIAKSEIIAIVAVDAQNTNHSVDLLWFRLSSTNKLINLWKWQLYKKITHLNVFQLVDDSDNFNILIANDRYENYTTIDWYQFYLGQHNDFWLKQALYLESPVKSTAISTHGSKTYLSIPQRDKLQIYSLQDSNTHFVNVFNFTVGHVSFVTSFKVAFQSYIAIDGHSAGIYKFGKKPNIKNSFLVKQHVENANLHGIDYWLAIPISTYRDEEILIAERTMDFSSHKSHAIQVIIHHGGRFVLHEEMTCDYYGEVSNGLNCLVEEENDLDGIIGSAFITVNDTLGVLVPRHQKQSGLFVVHTEMRELKSPLEERMNEFEEQKERIEEKIRLLKEKEKNIKNKGFPKKNLSSATPAEVVDGNPQAAMQAPDNIVAESSPMLSLNMDDITRRISTLQENINQLMKDVSNIPTLQAGQAYDNLIINGLVEIQGKSNIQHVRTDLFNGATTDKILGDIFQIHNEQPVNGHKTFTNLRVGDLEFNSINGKPSETLMYKSDKLQLDGDTVLQGELIVDGNVSTHKVDDITLEEEIVYIPSKDQFSGTLEFDSLNIRQVLNTNRVNKFPIHHNYEESHVEESPSLNSISFDKLYLPGNVTIDTINGEVFNDILKSICLKNQATIIPNTTIIKGNITVKNEALTLFLNGLKFPQDYVLSKSNSFSHISAEKIFKNDLIIGELTTTGKINGVDSNNVVTLSQKQKIAGKMSFARLDVTNSLQLDGEIIGLTKEHKQLLKPTLEDSQTISGDVSFKNLEVTGKVIITGNFNGSNLGEKLKDVVYKNAESVEINSVKKFPQGLTVLDNLLLDSDSINNVDINKFVHRDTEEVLNVNVLNGDVTFENILVTGSYDGVDIVKLEQETVKLSGEQFISSDVIFEEPLQADELDIGRTLNDIPLEEYLYSNGEVSMDSLNIDELVVDNLIVLNDLLAKEENFNLMEFNNKRFSLTKEQFIKAPFVLNSSRIPDLETIFINDYEFKDCFDLDVYSKKLMDLLMSGKLAIKELIVEDTILIEKINGKLMKDVLRTCLGTIEDERELEMNFQDIRFGDLQIENFNNIKFSELLENLVFKNETDVEILGNKVYFNEIEVKNYIQTSELNKISIYDILRKNEKQEVTSGLVIIGPVIIDGDCHLEETFNSIPIRNITSSFQALDQDTYQIIGDVIFEEEPIIESLRVETINGVKMRSFFNTLIYLNDKGEKVVGNLTFEAPVSINGNLNAYSIDGIDLLAFKDNVVIISQDGNLQYPVNFTADVKVQESVQIETDMYTGNIQGVNPADWKNRALFINKGKIGHSLIFESAIVESDITADYLNNIDLDTLIPLKSDLKISGRLSFDEIAAIKDIKVGKLVNNKKLEPEYLNTVMSESVQYIRDKVIFKGNIVVREDLDIYNLVNEHSFGKIVTTDTDQPLKGTYRFMERVIVDKDVIVSKLINSINFTKWQQNGVKKSYPESQLISNTWTTPGNITFKDDVTGYGKLNNWDIIKLAIDVEKRRAFKYSVETDLINNYQKICVDINTIITKAQKQIYSFKYLDYKQFIELPNNIEYVHQFEHQSKNYLLIKDQGCTAKLFVWMEEYFTLLQESEIGIISQIITVHDDSDVYLITRSSNKETKHKNKYKCSVKGSNAWKFDEEKLVNVQKLKDQSLLQKSRIPGTFYAIVNEDVLEYRLSSEDLLFYPVQKWTVPTKNGAFLEHGFKTGLAIRDGRHLFHLHRQEIPIGLPNDEIVMGNFTVIQNSFLPGSNGEMLLMNVGYPRWRKMIAVASHEETTVMAKLDFIKIYEDPISGKVFHKVPTFKPSSMISLEFGENGETLLIFLENKELLQIYEYKGVEGFKYRAKANIEGDKLVRIKLPCGSAQRPRSFIGLVDKNHFGLMEAIMDGDQLEMDQLTCSLT